MNSFFLFVGNRAPRAQRLSSYRNFSTIGQEWFISTPWLNPLRDLHLEPINHVIYVESMIPNLGVGFALRCFQRLSVPDIATQQCSWRNSWYTSGLFFSVLSSHLSSITRSVDYIFFLFSLSQTVFAGRWRISIILHLYSVLLKTSRYGVKSKTFSNSLLVFLRSSLNKSFFDNLFNFLLVKIQAALYKALAWIFLN